MPFQRYTLAVLQRQLRFRWNDSPFWTDDDATRALNEALLLWNALTGYWRTRQTIVIPANDPYATTTAAMVQNCSVSIANVPLVKGSLFGLSMQQKTWRRDTTLTTGITVPIVWAPIALNAFVIWPAATSDVQAVVDGVRQTPVLISPADFLDADDTVVSALLGYALHAAAMKAPAELLQRTQTYLQEFLLAAVDRNQALRATDWYKRVQRTSRQQVQQPYKRPALDASGGPGQL